MLGLMFSPIDLVKMALSVGEQGLTLYSCPVSRKDFTQPQLFALLVLRQFLHADYRKIVRFVAEWAELRNALNLAKVPHWTTLEKAHKRLLKKGDSIDSSIRSAIEPTAAA